jgi:protein gp37
MSDGTKIEWTDATWNVITGCSIKSKGCTNCYAMKLAGTRLRHHPSRVGLTQDSAAGPVWNGQVRFNDQWLSQPLDWKRPRQIFVCAHGDLFHESVPDEWIDKVFAVMALGSQHTFQLLTKRADRMRAYMQMVSADGGTQRWINHAVEIADSPCVAGFMEDLDWPLPNVWLGVSAEDQDTANERIPDLLATPAAVRWISAEPLLGPIDLASIAYGDGFYVNTLVVQNTEDVIVQPAIDWVVAGGESGQRARPMHPDWARSLRDQCASAGVAFHFKQWGEWVSVSEVAGKGDHHYFNDGATVRRVGKKKAGRTLEGVLHDSYPKGAL